MFVDDWKNILDEDILKININFAAVFVMNYECLKEFVIEQVRDFYSEHFYMDGDRIVCEESNAYKEKVRALDKNLENASLKWFMDAEAITQEDYDRNGVCGGQALILSIINEIIFGNEGDKYKELLNEFMKSDMSDLV